MKNEMRLQGIGLVEGTPAGELKVGDITRWNNGGIERVTSVEFSKTGKTVVVGIEYMSYSEVPTGKIVQSERKMRVTRLVNIIGGGNTVLVSDTRFESKPYEVVIDGNVVATLSNEEAPVEEVKIGREDDKVKVMNVNGVFEFEIDRQYKLEVEDEHGVYKLEHLCFEGFSDGRLKFEDLEMNTLHIKPKEIVHSYFQHAVATGQTDEEYVLNQMENETIETLTKRGRGVQLEQWCLWVGVSEYGTAQEKAERLLKWYEEKTAPAVKEFTIYSKNDVRIVTTPNGEFALTIGQRFNVDYKDEHGEYFIENMLFMGSGPANDCLLFKNDSGDILDMDPLKVQRVTIPFPFKTDREEEPKREVIKYRSMSWSLPYYSMFREIAVVDGNQFGYFVRKDENGEMDYKVMCFNNDGEFQQVLAYESDCEGVEKCINLFLLNGFQFGAWAMQPQNVRVKVIDNKKEREEKLLAAQSKVDRFERYRDILDKSLSRKGLTDEEREEMTLLYNELELSDSRNYYILAKAADMAIKGGVQS